jgi:hypothetical protein
MKRKISCVPTLSSISQRMVNSIKKGKGMAPSELYLFVVKDVMPTILGEQDVRKELDNIAKGEFNSNLGELLMGIGMSINQIAKLSNDKSQTVSTTDMISIWRDTSTKLLANLEPTPGSGVSNISLDENTTQELTSDDEVEAPSKVDTEDIPGEISIRKPLGSKNINEVLDHYLVGDLRKIPDSLQSFFQSMISKVWLSGDNQTNFTSEAIKAKLRDSLNAVVRNYYSGNAVEMITSSIVSRKNFISTDNLNTLIFNAESAIPSDSKLVHEDVDFGIKYYTNSSILGTDNMPMLLVVGEDPTMMLEQFLTNEELFGERAGNNTVIPESLQDGIDRKYSSIDRETVQDNYYIPEVRNTYFAQIINNELDTFIRSYAPMLDSTYKEIFRTSFGDIQSFGSSMANKLTKINISTTPLLYKGREAKDVKSSLGSLKSELSKSSNYYGTLANSSLLSELDTNGNKMISVRLDNKEYSGVMLDLGPKNLIVVNDGNSWLVPISNVDGDVSMVQAQELFRDSSNIDMFYEAAVISAVDFLNRNATDIEGLRNNTTEAKFDKSTFFNIIKNTNTPLTEDVDNINLFSNEGGRKFLQESDLEIASEVFQFLPGNIADASRYLARIASDTSSVYKDIARSLYYRFFKKGKYLVTSINPETGRLETTEQMSMYERYHRFNDTVARNSLISLMVQLRSSSLDNKAMVQDNEFIVTNVQKGTTLQSLISEIENSNTEYFAGKRVTPDKVYENFTVKELRGNEYAIEFYRFSSKSSPDIKFYIKDLGTNNDGRAKGNKFEVVEKDDSSSLNLENIGILSGFMGLPAFLSNKNFYNQLYDDSVTGNDVSNFFANVIALKLANGNKLLGNKNYTSSGASKLALVRSEGDIKHTFANNMYGYTNLLDTTIEKVLGNSKRAYIMSPEGHKLSVSIITNKAKSKQELVDQVKDNKLSESNLYRHSEFATGDMRLTNNGVTKNGIRVGVDGKGNAKLDSLEHVIYLMENAYLAHAEKRNFLEYLSQAGTMSDRTTVNLDGVSFESMQALPVKEGKLDEELLRKKFFEVQRNSQKGINESLLNGWNGFIRKIKSGEIVMNSGNIKLLPNSFTSISSLYNTLEKVKFDRNEVLKKSGLTDKSFIDDSKKIANIRYSIIMMDNVISSQGDGLRSLFLDTYLNTFKQYLKDVEYKISPKAVSILANRFPSALSSSNGFEHNRVIAQEILTRSFFYQDTIAEQNLISILSGNVFQYKSKIPSVFEKLNAKNFKSDIDKLRWLGEQKGYENKSIVESTFAELEKLGSEGNRLGFIKSILDSNLSDKQKLSLLYFDDLYTQITPMYVDRVKRNQGSGTSFQNYVFAADNSSGFLIDKTSKEILVKDPETVVKLLGSGSLSQDIYDAVQMAHPLFFYKHNMSLGDKFSNFRSRSIIKDVNASNFEDTSEYLLQKKATFPMFNWEFIFRGTPEHNNLFSLMNSRIKLDIDGLFLDENPLLPFPNFGTTISEEVLLNHGEYLGELLVDGNKTTASELLYLHNNNEIDLSTLDIKSNKVYKTGFYTLQDIYNYYGGAQGDLDAYNSADNKTAFIEEFPFGWTWFKIGEIITNYRGVENNYPIRNSYISKLGFTSQSKTGSRNINEETILSDKLSKYDEVEYAEIPNRFSGPVLDAEHEPDTTAELSMSEEAQNNMVSMITQVMSASIAQGESFNEVEAMFGALGTLSDLQLNIINEKLSDYEASSSSLNKLSDSVRRYALELAQETMTTRKDPGSTSAFLGLGTERLDKISFDLKQILPLVRQSLNAHLNSQTVRFKMKGGQYIVSPSHDQIKTYSFGKSTNLFRSSMNSGNNDVNSMIVDAVKTDTLPNGWELNTVTSLDQFDRYHTNTDTVFIREDKESVSDLVPVKVSELLKDKSNLISLIENGLISSAWVNPDPGNTVSAKARSIEGNTLSWLNYFKDGKNIYNTDEYYSYYLAGKAPLYLSNLKENTKNNAEYLSKARKFFSDETEGSGVPKLLWARYYYNSLNKNNTLSLSPLLPESSINKAYESFDINNEEQFLKFLNYIKRQKSDPRFFTNQFKSQLQSQLENGNWRAKEAEFYMPPMHQSAFLIDYGDSIQDIIGTQEQPDVERVRDNLSEEEINIITNRFNSSEAQSIKDKLKNTTFLRLKEEQNQHMLDYFLAKINNLEKLSRKSSLKESEKESLMRRSPLFLLQNSVRNKDTLSKAVDKLLTKEVVLANSSNTKDLITLKQELINNRGSASEILDDALLSFKEKWSATLANNFEKSLTFITARIPAQGKQSYTVGKIKNFIYSTRNAIYGPLEMLTVTGADYDIDKQNNMAWDVDDHGTVIDWTPYLDKSGKINAVKINNVINKSTSEFREQLEQLGLTDIDNRVSAFKKNKINFISRAVQNFVVDRLMKGALDPVNGIEAATAVSMRKLGVIKEVMDSFNFENLGIDKYKLTTTDGKYNFSESLVKAIQKRQHALPFSPSTKMIYERVNMDGKTGVGIYASALKAYLATYYAWLKNNSITNYNSTLTNRYTMDDILNASEKELQSIHDAIVDEDTDRTWITFTNKFAPSINRDAKKIPKGTKTDLSLDNNALHFIWKDPETGLFEIKSDIYSLANTGKHMPSVGKTLSKIKTQRAKEVYKRIGFADEQEQVALLSKYMDDLNLLDNYNTESQAWEDLSELLSAATDNAKELILGKIGSNATTSSIISVMVVLGIDLQNALLLINDTKIKDIVSLVEQKSRLLGVKDSYIPALSKLLENKIDKYKPNEELSDEKIEQLVRKSATANTPEKEINARIEKQKVLRKHYNPYEQFMFFTKAADELTKLSRILSINQGLPNSEFEVFNYIRNVEDAIGAPIEEFVGDSNMSAADIDAKRLEIIKKYDVTKTVFNIPYILLKNEHYFSYIKSLLKSNNILKNLSYTVRLVYNDLNTNLPVDKTSVTKSEFTNYINTLTDFVISKFYKSPSVNSIVNLGKYGSYDLSKVSSGDTDIKGRQEFIKEFPDILNNIKKSSEELNNNTLLSQISRKETETDIITKESFDILGGINTETTTVGDIANFKILLKNIQKTHPDLYNALFNYSLIINKGGLGKSSLTSLFDLKIFEDFENFLNTIEKEKLIEEEFHSLSKDVKGLLIPMLLQQFPTKTGVKILEKTLDKSGLTDEELEQEFSESQESEENLHEFMEEDFSNIHRDYREEIAKNYDVSSILSAKISGNIHAPDIFKSRTNNLVYAYNEKVNDYVPITKTISNRVIPIDITTDTDVLNNLSTIGYDWGWEIEMPNGTKARLLNLSDRAKGTYNVLQPDGTVIQMKDIDIMTFNPNVRLYYEAIKILPGKFEKKYPYNFFKDKNTGDITVNDGDSAIPIKIEVKDTDVIRSSDKTVLTSYLVDLINSKVKNKPKENKKFDDILKLFDDLVNEVEVAIQLSSMPDNTDVFEAQQAIKSNPNPAINHVRSVLYNLPLVLRYSLLRKPESQKIDYIKKIVGSNMNITSWPKVRGSKVKDMSVPKIFESDIELLTKEELASQLQIMDYLPILKWVGISENVYRKAINKKVLVDGNKVYTDPTIIKNIDEDVKFDKAIPIPEVIRQNSLNNISPVVIERLGAFVRSRFTGVSVKVLGTSDIVAQYGEKYNHAAFVKDGTIVLNRDKATLDSAMHEMGHLYLAEIKNSDKELYINLMSLASRHEDYNLVKKLYPELSPTDIAEEVFVGLLSKNKRSKLENAVVNEMANTLSDENGNLWGKVINFFRNLFKGFVGNSTINNDFIDLDTNLTEALNTISDDILYGKNSKLYNFTSSFKQDIKKSNPSYEMSTSEARAYLEERGFIRWICN